jgi:CHASE2 domain-containing sensor protein
MRLKFWLDTLGGTVFIFFIIGFMLNLFDRLDFLDPIGDALDDMELTDIVFSRIREHPGADTNMVVVNVGNLSRDGIAEQINILNSYNPKVIALDFFLRQPKNAYGDSVLAEALSHVENLVMVGRLDYYNEETKSFDTLETSHPMFTKYGVTGFANLITDAENQNRFKTCRSFTPKEYFGIPQKPISAFAVRIAEIYDPQATKAFLDRGKPYELINFRGNILGSEGEFANVFPSLDVEDVFRRNFTPEMIRDKIVLLGYTGAYLGDTSWEDKFYTPLNLNYAGKTNPDMFGVVIHANILSMILQRNYLNQMGTGTSIFLGILLCFLNVVWFSKIYMALPKWYDGLTKAIQVAEAFLFLALIILVFYFFN